MEPHHRIRLEDKSPPAHARYSVTVRPNAHPPLAGIAERLQASQPHPSPAPDRREPAPPPHAGPHSYPRDPFRRVAGLPDIALMWIQRAGATPSTAPRSFHLPDESAHPRVSRSEEHTSELQSLMRISYAVFCLKKKNNNKQST